MTLARGKGGVSNHYNAPLKLDRLNEDTQG